MISFIGLGNPGNKYENTKHNAGFWILDELSRRWKTNFKPGKGEYFFIEKKSWNILLIKPTIGMNNNCFFAIIDGASIASLRKIASARD